MCILLHPEHAVDPESLPARTLRRVEFHVFSPRPDGSDSSLGHKVYRRPGQAPIPRFCAWEPAWTLYSAWWPGSGLPAIDPGPARQAPLHARTSTSGCAEFDAVELTQASASINRPDARRSPRTPRLRLLDSERGRQRSQLAQVSSCGRSYASLLRVEPGESSCTLHRLAVQRRCGTRLCPVCDLERRQRAATRIEGPWKTFLTIGVPARTIGIREAWSRMSSWVERLAKALRAASSFDDQGPVRVDVESADYCHSLKIAAGRKRELASPIDYAWTLEPHQSGWPHLHLVTTAYWVCSRWLRDQWSRIIGSSVRWRKIKRVTSPDGACRYLTKYVTKTHLPPDLLAVLYRKRLLACTLPLLPPDPQWSPDTLFPDPPTVVDLHLPEHWAARYGWSVAGSRAAHYAHWTREIRWETVASLLPELATDAWMHLPLWLRALWPGYRHDRKEHAKLVILEPINLAQKIVKKSLDTATLLAHT